MSFIDPNLEVILQKLNQLRSDTQPKWGQMVAQRMVEHLSDSLDLSVGAVNLPLQIAPEHAERALAHLRSEKPMPQNFKASYAPPSVALRNDELETAIDELSQKWVHFEDHFSEYPDATHLHPIYGKLDGDLWRRMHSKHFTHHFEQFGLL